MSSKWPLPKKRSFPLRISPLNVTKSAHWRNPYRKTSFFIQWTQRKILLFTALPNPWLKQYSYRRYLLPYVIDKSWWSFCILDLFGSKIVVMESNCLLPKKKYTIWNSFWFYVVLTVWKVSKYGVFSGPYFPLFWSKSPNSIRIQENMDQKKLRIWTLFTQCKF